MASVGGYIGIILHIIIYKDGNVLTNCKRRGGGGGVSFTDMYRYIVRR